MSAGAPSGPLDEQGAQRREIAEPLPLERGPRHRLLPSPGRAARLLPAVAAVVFVVLHIFAFPATTFSNDSYRYARQAYEYLGDDREQAQHKALEAYCRDDADRRYRAQLVDEMRYRAPRDPAAFDRCMAASPNGLGPTDARYERIFDTRPLYPLLAAPFVGLFGAKAGLTAVSLAFTLAGGLFLRSALREAGLSPGLALLGQCLYYVTPLAAWGSQPLAEGPLLALLASMLLGAVAMLRGRTGPGAMVYAGALALSAGVKYSSAQLAAVCMTAVTLVMLLGVRRTRHRGTYWLLGISAAAAAAVAAAGRLLDLPGTADTLQDTFSKHWTRPEVAEPWWDLLRLNYHFWWQWLQKEAMAPLLLFALALAVWGLWRRSAPLALVVIGLGGTGLATVVAHPVWFQAERLYAPVWLIVAAGLPVLVHQVLQRAGERRDATAST